jgi:hypothetical protein
VLSLQQTAGNAAVAGVLRQAAAPAAAGPAAVHHTAAELYAMTLTDFDDYASKQADWHADSSIPAADRTKLRNLLEFARENHFGDKPILTACGDMTVRDLVDTGLTSVVRSRLRTYSIAVAQSEETIELDSTTDVAKARDLGRDIAKLEGAIGKPLLHRSMKQKGSRNDIDLLNGDSALDDWVRYCRICRPTLDDEENNKEVRSFLALRGEGVDPASFHGRLPHVVNYHRFHKDVLVKAQANLRDFGKSKPLTIYIQSPFDHNGAFHRDPNVRDMFNDTRNLTLLIEGEGSLSSLSHLLHPLAARYGRGGKIEQVMLAGHGNAQGMELTGTVDRETGDRSQQDVASGARDDRRETDAFFHELLRNMASSPNSRVVLNACLTASNVVNQPLDSDPTKAAHQVQTAIDADPSLTRYLRNMSAADGVTVDVRGSNASFGQVPLEDSSGRLDIDPGGASHLTSSKLEYIEFGTEPQGCLRAVLEVWADDRLASPPRRTALDAVHRRINTPAGRGWDETIVKAMYQAVERNPDNGELIRLLGEPAGALSEMAGEDAWARPGYLMRIPAGERNTIFGALESSPQWAGLDPRVHLVVYEAWLKSDATKRASFVTALGGFTVSTALQFVDFGHLGADVAQMLPTGHAAAPSNGELVLSLLGVDRDRAPVDTPSRDFLLGVIGTATNFSSAMAGRIRTALGGRSDTGSVERAIGRGTATPASTGTGSGSGPAQTPNVDLDGDGVNDFWVEPMTRRGATTARSLRVRERPDLSANVLDALPRGAHVDVIGKSGDWYAIEYRGRRTAFVHQDWVRLAAAL